MVPKIVSRHALLVAFIALLGTTMPAKADIIFTTLVGNCCGGEGIAGAFSASVAEAFTPAADYVVTDAQVEVFQNLGFGGDPFFNISLYSNDPIGPGPFITPDGVPGALIANFGTDLMAPNSGGIVVGSGPTPRLTAGTRYWLVLSPFDSTTNVGWEYSPGTSVPLDTISTAQGIWRDLGPGSSKLGPARNHIDTTGITPLKNADSKCAERQYQTITLPS